MMKSIILVLLVAMVTVQVQSVVLDGIIPGCDGCSVKGICYHPWQKWRQGCWTKQCKITNGGFGWKTSVVKTQCPDTYNRCIDHGQQASNGCYCKVKRMHWEYICGGK